MPDMHWNMYGQANPRSGVLAPYAVEQRRDGFCANVALTIRGFNTINDAKEFAQRIEDVVQTRDAPPPSETTLEEWLAYGHARGFCTEQYCSRHAGDPLSPSEENDDNGDFCVHVVRLGTPERWEEDYA